MIICPPFSQNLSLIRKEPGEVIERKVSYRNFQVKNKHGSIMEREELCLPFVPGVRLALCASVAAFLLLQMFKHLLYQYTLLVLVSYI